MVLALLGAAVGSYLGGAPACAPGWRRSAVRCQVPVPAAASEFVAISPKEIKVRWLNEALELAAPPSESEAIAAIRDAALVPAQQVQLPGRKDEAWRQTDMASLFATRMVAPLEPPSGALVEQYLEEESAGMRLAFVNGIYSEELSDLSALPEGVQAGSLASLGADAQAEALPMLRQLPEEGQDKRTALGCYWHAAVNQASLGDIACVRVAEGVQVEMPLAVVMVSTGPMGKDAGVGTGSEAAISHPNLLVQVGTGASLTLMQQYAGAGAYFTNALSRFQVGEEATLRHAYVQEQSGSCVHLDSVCVGVGRHGRYEVHAVQMGSKLARLNMDVRLLAPFASCDVNGIALASERQVSDLHSAITHVSRDCESAQEQRNAISDRANGIWRGAVRVPRGSDNSTANQLCRSLLLSDKARVHVTPTLEIKTDDVVCTHGATVADLDDEMVFYLQSRGLDRLGARSLLLQGWAREVMANVPSPGAQERAIAKAAELSPEDRTKLENMRQVRQMQSI